MEQLPKEQVILESDAKTLVLTTHRVRYTAGSWNRAEVGSIMLEHVASCGLTHRSYPLLLVLAALAALGGFYLGGDAISGGLLIAVVCVVTYVFTRRGVLSVRSAGHAITVPARGMPKDQLLAFIDEVELAKNQKRLQP